MNKQELIKGLHWIRDSYDDYEEFRSGVRLGLALAISEVEHLDEPAKVEPLIVPKYLGNWLSKQTLGNEGSLFGIIGELEDMWADAHIEDFITDNKKQLIEVILGNRGYEVEKEKLYQVIIPTKDAVWECYYLDHDGGIDVASNSKYADSHTESEIKAIDERYWAFAVEVTEGNK